MTAIQTIDSINLPLLHRGKVREIYGAGDDELLMITSDRISAFDVILPSEIPGKGEILNRISNFWFNYFEALVPNHLSTTPLEQIIPHDALRQSLIGRSIVAKKLQPLPIEAIVRGYIIGSGWKDYSTTGAICGIPLPDRLRLADRLPTAIYTPSTKAAVGEHDENISFKQTINLVGERIAEQVRDLSLTIYSRAAKFALERGIIIADTKLEFGLDEHGTVYLMDEVLTPDSSRFWPVDSWQPGISPPSFDKQFVRDYLESLDWDKTSPGPELPEDIILRTAENYWKALKILTSQGADDDASSLAR